MTALAISSALRHWKDRKEILSQGHLRKLTTRSLLSELSITSFNGGTGACQKDASEQEKKNPLKI